MSQPPFEAYTGSQPYIFISYAHRDADLVFPLIQTWHLAGYRLWYDEGIDPGNEWPEEIAAALEGCRQFIVFISSRSVNSKNVKNEINFALNLEKDFIAVHLEETELPAGLRLRMGDIQAIMKYRMPEVMFRSKMERVLAREAHEVAAAETVLPREKAREKTPPIEAAPEAIDPKSLSPERQSKVRTVTDPIVAGVPPASTADPAVAPPKGESINAAEPSDLAENLKRRFQSRRYEKMSVAEIKKTVVDDFGFIKDEVVRQVKNGLAAPNPEVLQKRQERAEARAAALEQKKLQREIRLQMKKEEKQERAHARRRGGCLPIPLSVIVIGVLVYFLVFHETYSSLSEEFLETSCPAVYTTERKIALIGEYERSLSKHQRTAALKDAIDHCEQGDESMLRAKQLGLTDKSIEELQTYFLELTRDSKTLPRKLVEKAKAIELTRIKENMPPEAGEVFTEVMEGGYRELLIQLILEADSQNPISTEPIEELP